jgi:hypothetical protein
MAVTAPQIRLSVDRIVLDGIPLGSRRRLQRAFEQECVAAFAETAGFVPDGAVAVGRPVIRLAPNDTPEAIGRALARAIVGLVRR